MQIAVSWWKRRGGAAPAPEPLFSRAMLGSVLQRG